MLAASGSPSMQPARVLVRVQAKGGMFLGGGTHIILLDAASGKLFAEGRATGGSGQLSNSFSPAASRHSIVTSGPGGQDVLWLSANPAETTAGLMATLDLAKPTLVEFIARSANGNRSGNTVTQMVSTVTQMMWIAPGADLSAEPGVVLVMPGLDVRILATQRVGEVLMSLSASVSMMCGGRIDSRSPWPPSEFSVIVTVIGESGTVVQAPLAFRGAGIFADEIELPGPGSYQVTVSAVQAAAGNAGGASTVFNLDEFPYW